MIFDEVVKKIEDGKEGRSKGLSMGFDRLVEYVPNIQKGTYYLVGSESGIGKTAFADNCFVFNPYDYIQANPEEKLSMKVIYYSFEIDKHIKITKAICRKMFTDYGILVDVNFVLSRGKNRISTDVYEAVKATKGYFEKLEDILIIYDSPVNPTGINHQVISYLEANGKIIGKTIETDKGSLEIFDKYIPNNKNEYVIVIVDHLSLAKREKSYNEKDNIDKISNYMIRLRNNFEIIPVMLQQFNRSISSADRAKIDRVVPQRDDYKGSGVPFEDSNVAFGLFSPHRYGFNQFLGYNIKKLKNKFISLSLLKNRDGESDKIIGMKFNGKVGHFEELKPAKEMTDADYLTV